MGLLLSTAASLMLVSGGSYGIELMMDRYATPEARIQAKTKPSAALEREREHIDKQQP